LPRYSTPSAGAGAVITAITKSGTNQWHGSAYDFLRNDRLDASNFSAQPGIKPLLVQNQYGGPAGATIVRNRAWIFGAYEGLHSSTESVGFATVPTAAMRQGNFGSTAVYDPASTAPNPSGSGFVQTQFPGNVIPDSRFDKIDQELMAFYPLPNLPGANDYTRNLPHLQTSQTGVVRGDIQVTPKDSMFWRGAVTRSSVQANNPLPAPAHDPADRAINAEGAAYGYTRTFTTTLVNQLRFSWTRMTINQDETTPLDDIMPGLLDPRVQHGTANFNPSGFAGIGVQPAKSATPRLSRAPACGISPTISRNRSESTR